MISLRNLKLSKQLQISFQTEFLTELSISPNQYTYLVMLAMGEEYPIPAEDIEILEAKKYIKIGQYSNTLRYKGKQVTQGLTIETSGDFIGQYRSLFEGLKSKSIGNKKLVEKNMARFRTLYDYTDDQILEATQNYINENSETNYKYIRQADYFIFKTVLKERTKIELSDLLTYCEQLQEEENTMV